MTLEDAHAPGVAGTGPDPVSVLAETGRRLTVLGDQYGFATSVPPGEPAWAALGTLVSSGRLDGLASGLVTGLGRRDVAGSYLGARLAAPLVARTVAAVLTERRCPDPTGAWLRIGPDAKTSAVAWPEGNVAVAVLADDPAAGAPGTVVADSPAALAAWWARLLVAAVDPLLEATRARLPFGRRGLWGSVAAKVGSTAVALDRERDGCGSAGWAQATVLLDALAAAAPVPLTRPQALLVRWSGGEAWYSTKGTCCLKYHVKADVDRASGTGYCSTCPLVPETPRHQKLATKLDRAAEDQGDHRA